MCQKKEGTQKAIPLYKHFLVRNIIYYPVENSDKCNLLTEQMFP